MQNHSGHIKQSSRQRESEGDHLKMLAIYRTDAEYKEDDAGEGCEQ